MMNMAANALMKLKRFTILFAYVKKICTSLHNRPPFFSACRSGITLSTMSFVLLPRNTQFF